MNQQYRAHTRVYTMPGRSLFERILLGILGLGILILAFFFLTVALVAGALIAAVVLARWWWIMRKIRAAQAKEIIEGEYTTVDRESAGRRIRPPER